MGLETQWREVVRNRKDMNDRRSDSNLHAAVYRWRNPVSSTWISERASVKGFGALGSGVINDTPGFQAAINSVAPGSSISVYVPSGNYLLATDVLENGRVVSWMIDRSAVFGGPGKLPAAVSDNYGALTVSTSAFAVKRGLTTALATEAGSLIVAELRSSKSFVAGHANAAIPGLASKHTTDLASVFQATGYSQCSVCSI